MLAFFTIDGASKSADYWFKENSFEWWSKEGIYTPSYSEIKKTYKMLKKDVKDNMFSSTGRLSVHKKRFLFIPFYIYIHEV